MESIEGRLWASPTEAEVVEMCERVTSHWLGANPSEADVLEMWLEANELGLRLLPAASPWRDVALQVRVALLADLGRQPLRSVGAEVRDPDGDRPLRFGR